MTEPRDGELRIGDGLFGGFEVWKWHAAVGAWLGQGHFDTEEQAQREIARRQEVDNDE